jgi:hypothetical protein
MPYLAMKESHMDEGWAAGVGDLLQTTSIMFQNSTAVKVAILIFVH